MGHIANHYKPAPVAFGRAGRMRVRRMASLTLAVMYRDDDRAGQPVLRNGGDGGQGPVNGVGCPGPVVLNKERRGYFGHGRVAQVAAASGGDGGHRLIEIVAARRAVFAVPFSPCRLTRNGSGGVSLTPSAAGLFGKVQQKDVPVGEGAAVGSEPVSDAAACIDAHRFPTVFRMVKD